MDEWMGCQAIKHTCKTNLKKTNKMECSTNLDKIYGINN